MHAIEQPIVGQADGEDAGGPHRPDRVRAGRPDTDREQVEHADGHQAIIRPLAAGGRPTVAMIMAKLSLSGSFAMIINRGSSDRA
jgi:hypothetical protein